MRRVANLSKKMWSVGVPAVLLLVRENLELGHCLKNFPKLETQEKFLQTLTMSRAVPDSSKC